MLAALANVLRVPELRRRVIFTLVMFAVFRLGTHIPVPGVNAAMIEQLFNNGNLFGLLDLFSGGALSKFSIFAMSITPYINASIILQLLKVVIPTLEEWSKEGQEGYKKINKTTRYLTVVLAVIQGFGMAFGLRSAINNPNIFSVLMIVVSDYAERYRQRYLPDHLCGYRFPPPGRHLHAGKISECRYN